MKHYLIYKTTNLVNGKFYIGAHITSNKEDGYLGSGKLLLKAISKYGRGAFKKEILYICENRKEMYAKEASVVCENLVKNEACYNLIPGGRGGTGKKMSEDSKKKISSKNTGKLHTNATKKKLSEAGKLYYKTNENPMLGKKASQETRDKISTAGLGKKVSNSTRKKMSEAHTGKALSEETREKISKSKKGENNFFYKKSWYNNETEEGRFSKDEIPKGWLKGRLPFSEEMRLKISEAGKLYYENNESALLGRKKSDEEKMRISEASRGKKRTQETKDRISRGLTGRVFSEEHKHNLRKAAKARTGKHWYNKEKEEMLFFENEVPSGWKKGRLKKGKTC